MLAMIYSLVTLPIAQMDAWDDAPKTAPPPEPPHHMSFADLKDAMHAVNTGEAPDNGFRNGILVLLAIIALVALILHLRQRHKTAGPPASVGKLGLELARPVRFPMGTKMLLMWVARTARVPLASLLISSVLFDKSIAAWAAKPTLSAARQWGRARLARLRPELFGA